MRYGVRPELSLLFLVFVLARAGAADAPVPEQRVARAVFTSRIVGREPVDRVLVMKSPATAVYFFTDLRHLQGHTVIHRWRYKGQTVSLVPFVVAGDRWRVYSKKVLPPDSYGEWSVTVTDDNGWPLYVELFRYEPADAGTERREAISAEEVSVETRALPVATESPSE